TSDCITRQKYDELYELAISIREQKNIISKVIASDIFTYLDKNPLTFVTEMRTRYKGIINSNYDKQLYQQVIDAYQNKFEAINKKIKFENVEFVGFEFYKRDTKNNKKGDLKKVATKRKSTPLSTCLTYLARYGNANTVEYINTQLASKLLDDKKTEFYQTILEKINKFGFERLMKPALQRRDCVIRRYSKPIEFKSLAFSGRSRKKLIVGYNKNYNSKISAFVSLSFPTRKTMDIPVKFSKDYHGLMLDYVNKSSDYEYVMCFDERKKQVKVNIVKSGTRYLPTVNENDKCVGVDVNVKHNLFSLSNGASYDYDRELLSDFCKLKRQVSALKKNNKGYKVGKRKQHKIDMLRNKMLKSNQQLISSMCKELMLGGVRHIVMENLDNGFGKSYVKDETLYGINFNDIVKFLGISSLKQEVEHIGRKYGIAVSTVQSNYTSKMCPVCGCIEDENRPNQETFCCVECGHRDNADHNAAVNIKNRVGATVLRQRLLKQLDNGTYKPLKLTKDKIKSVLLSYRTNNLKVVENL
ncbi:MAG: transposase, partial [Alphaproteobacteria bacterium]|nr:transposase [Alphaproteobacteria bacterium]